MTIFFADNFVVIFHHCCRCFVMSFHSLHSVCVVVLWCFSFIFWLHNFIFLFYYFLVLFWFLFFFFFCFVYQHVRVCWCMCVGQEKKKRKSVTNKLKKVNHAVDGSRIKMHYNALADSSCNRVQCIWLKCCMQQHIFS